LLEPILSYDVEAEKVDKVEKWDVEGCIVNVADVVAVEGVVVGDAEDVPSSIVESVWLVVVVVVMVQVVFLHTRFSFPRLLGPWTRTRDRRVDTSRTRLNHPFISYNPQTHTHASSSLDTLLHKAIHRTGQ
jgi:hypothetical protein